MRQPIKIESQKKLSRKALRNADQRGPLATVLAVESGKTSRSGSRKGSRNVSRPASRAASTSPTTSDPSSIAESLSDSESSSDDEDSAVEPFGISRLMRAEELLRARKRTNKDTRLAALRSLTQCLGNRYLCGAQSLDERRGVAEKMTPLIETLVSTIQRSESIRSSGKGRPGNDNEDGSDADDGDEKRMALEALSVAMLSSPSTANDKTFAAVAKIVRHECQEASNSSRCAATAVRTLAIVALIGGSANSIAQFDLLRFLLEIVQTDGDSVHHLDDAAVVTAALQAWAFAAAPLVNAIASAREKAALDWKHEQNVKEDEEDEEDEEDGEDEEDEDDFLVEHSTEALEAFVDQLESTDMSVQLHAGVAICLLFEASRAYRGLYGRPLPLRRDPVELAQQMRLIARGGAGSRSAKSTARNLRRQMRDVFGNVATSLEYGVGPGYRLSRPTVPTVPKRQRGMDLDLGEIEDSTAFHGGAALDGDLAKAHGVGAAFSSGADGVSLGNQNRLRVRNRDVLVDTWALEVRAELLRGALRGGFVEHLASNPTVCTALEMSALEMS